MQYLNIFISFLLFLLFPQNECRYPCLNDGEPILLGQNSNEFRCECLTGFFGPFCEYQDTSQSIKEKPPIPTSTSLFSHSATNNLASITSGQQRGWETTFVNLLICVFFLLLLPSLVKKQFNLHKYFYYFWSFMQFGYFTCYLNDVTPTIIFITKQQQLLLQTQINQQRPTPPPHYWAAMGVADELRQQNNDINSNQQQRSLTWLLPLTESGGEYTRRHLPLNNQQQQRMRRRRRSPITEVTVQLPTSICRGGRPIHSSRSVGGPIPLHQSQSLTLAEFHELLLRIQQEMQTRQHLEGIEQQRQQQQLNTSTNWETEQQSLSANQQNYHNDLPNNSLSTYPIEPPPSYNELTNQQ
uniref:EGF-like domain-containing protein n=1 Tax=Meloidogyne incognita TaxID=6306 RepID=A0A914MVR4_MELIC